MPFSDFADLNKDEKYMRRALQLARNGGGRVSPNPMVGAVIVYKDRIIGEGYHAFYGGNHAEVNAVNSVKPEDKPYIQKSTMYVTLEPCAHFGKTPPCADLIVKTGIPNVVIGSLDPNPKVAGKGVQILRDAGITVAIGCMEEECKELNRRFLKAQSSVIPYIILKWAQSSDGFVASLDEKGSPVPYKFSNSISTVWMHRERSMVDVVMIGTNTERIDKPKLNVREWGGTSPKKIVAASDEPLINVLRNLRKEGVTSLMVEGGSKLLSSFIDQGFYDEIRVETAPERLKKGLKAPTLPEDVFLKNVKKCRNNIIVTYRR